MVFSVKDKQKQVTELCRRFFVKRLDVFGSAATDEFDPARSDIDFLVEFEDGARINRFDCFFNLLEELQKLFGRPVDLVEPGGLRNPYFIRRVNETRRCIYAAS